jgi:hypothetical protein
MQSGSDDDMVLEIAKQRYKNQICAKFKRFTGGKLLGTKPSGGEGRMLHPQWIHLSSRVMLQPRRR